MGSWRKRKREVTARTAEINEKYGMDVAIESKTLTAVSGKLDDEFHYRTLQDGSIRVCKNPCQTVHGESLSNAHKMRDVMRQAREEYHDSAKRAEWEREYEEALVRGETRARVLWNFICQQIYKSKTV